MLLVLFWVAIGSAQTKPAIVCSSEQEGTYVLTLQKNTKQLEILQQNTRKVIPLTDPNIAFAKRPLGDWLVYHAENLDLGQEVRLRYVTDGEKTQIHLGFTLDHKPVKSLSCVSKDSFAKVHYENDSATYENYLMDIFSQFSSVRRKTGHLDEMSTRILREAIQRLALRNPQETSKDLTKRIQEETLKIHSPSIAAIGSKLGKVSKAFWERLLKDARYTYFPESKRFTIWVKEGALPAPQRDLPSVTAGFNGFVALPAFHTKDLKKHFSDEVSSSVKTITEDEFRTLRTDLTPSAKLFFDEVWIASTGRKTLANYPVLDEILRNLSSTLDKDVALFDVQTLEKRILAFYRSSLAYDPDAKKIFVEKARPLLKKLTPRQVEDLLSWVDEENRPLFEALLK